MSLLEQMKSYIASVRNQGLEMSKVQTSRAALENLRREMGLAPDAAVIVDGVPFEAFETERDEQMSRARLYAATRWGVDIPDEDLRALLKAVPDDELKDLIPLIVDQQLDDMGYDDPLDDADDEDVENMNHNLGLIGFDPAR